jgi:HemK-related putative methylase
MIGRLWGWGLQMRFRLRHRHRHRRLIMEHVHGLPFVVLPDVFNPALFRTSAFLVEVMRDHLHANQRVLDLGTGSGVAAIHAAQIADEVTAVDINPAAVRCTQINTLLNHVEERVQVCQSDLFTALTGQQFDLVLFNPPFYSGQPHDNYDHAWRSGDVMQQFITVLPDYLTPGGYALVVLSTDRDEAVFDALQHLHIEPLASSNLINEILTVYKLTVE